jgi:hypothetical protein
MGILSNDIALQMINGLYNCDYVQEREEDNMVNRQLVEWKEFYRKDQKTLDSRR